MAATNAARLSMFSAKQDAFPVHYSSPAVVTTFLLRSLPESVLRMQNCLLGLPEKVFTSLKASYTYSFNSMGDVKELTPEFFSTPEFLINVEGGELTQGDSISNVELPPWARDYEDFIARHRQALESDVVSENLHAWIDLIFGYKQRGKDALHNTFHDEAYGLSATASELQLEAQQVLAQMYGICPVQLFTSPHPPRTFRKLKRTAEATGSERLAQLEYQLAMLTAKNAKEIREVEEQMQKALEQQRLEAEGEAKRLHEELLKVQREKFKAQAQLEQLGAVRSST